MLSMQLPDYLVNKLLATRHTDVKQLLFYNGQKNMDMARSYYDGIYEVYSEVRDYIKNNPVDIIQNDVRDIILFLAANFSKPRDPKSDYHHTSVINSNKIGERIIFVKESIINRGNSPALHNGLVVYTADESDLIDVNQDEKTVKMIHSIKKIFEGQIVSSHKGKNESVKILKDQFPVKNYNNTDNSKMGVIKI